MNRRTAIAIAAATITTLGTGAVTAAAMSGTDVGLGRDDARLEIVATTTTDDNSPTSARSDQARRSSDDTSTTTSTTAPTTTRRVEDNPDRTSSSTTRTTAPTPVDPAANTTTFRSVGGEVDVTWTARTLTIVAVRPAAGFGAENEGGDGDEVEAEFESTTHNSKITVRLVNGTPSVSIRERDDNDRVGDDNSGGDDSNRGHSSESTDDHGGRG
ncbi:MAG: hypothetical protein ABI658_07680 [Acidimicrobiales bacterium]